MTTRITLNLRVAHGFAHAFSWLAAANSQLALVPAGSPQVAQCDSE